MFAVDLHTHTRFFHGLPWLGRRYDPLGSRLLTGMAGMRGLDGVAVTNHDYSRHVPAAEGVTVIPGIEVSTTKGHVLVVGPDPPASTDPGELTPRETVSLARERDCAAIIAHPFRDSSVRTVDADFDAIEINGKGSEPRNWVRELAEARDLPLVAGSDAHYPVEVARAYTLVDGDELTPESVVDAIRDGRVSTYVDDHPAQQALRAAYRIVHGRKESLDRPDEESPGLGAPSKENRSR